MIHKFYKDRYKKCTNWWFFFFFLYPTFKYTVLEYERPEGRGIPGHLFCWVPEACLSACLMKPPRKCWANISCLEVNRATVQFTVEALTGWGFAVLSGWRRKSLVLGSESLPNTRRAE